MKTNTSPDLLMLYITPSDTGKCCYTVSREAKWEESHTREISPFKITKRENRAK